MAEPSAPMLEDLDSDEDMASVLSSPRFLKKVIDNMDEKTQQLYETELKKKKEEMMRRKEIKREQEIRHMEEEKLCHEKYLQRMKNNRDAEMSLLGNILKYIWLMCFLVHISIFLIRNFSHYFEDYSFVTIILSESALSIHSLVTLPFVALSVMTMILFTDG